MPTDDAPPKKKASFWWPSVGTPEDAREVSKGGAGAFGLIAFSYLLVATIIWFGGHTPFAPDPAVSAVEYVSIDVTIAAIAAYLSWRTYRRPTVLLCSVAFIWVLLELVGKIMMASPNVGSFWINVIGIVAATSGVRGALALRGFKRQSSSPAVP